MRGSQLGRSSQVANDMYLGTILGVCWEYGLGWGHVLTALIDLVSCSPVTASHYTLASVSF